MLIIAHRGLLHGPNPSLENQPDQIDLALAEGFDVEVDVWVVDGRVWLGHDTPTHQVDRYFLLERDGLWCHAKNLTALQFLLHEGVHCFWHDKDQFTLTSQGHVWAYPNAPANGKTVCVMPELYSSPPDLAQYLAVCTDYPSRYEV